MREFVLAGLIAVVVLSCQQSGPTGPTVNTSASALFGYWADYKCVLTNDYYDAGGNRVNNTYTNDYSTSISEILYIDSTYLQWNKCLNGVSCYTQDDPNSYSITGTDFVSKPFEGIDVVGTDTLRASNTIGMSGTELIITTTLSGSLHGQPARIIDEYHYTKTNPFPPAYWPQRQCN